MKPTIYLYPDDQSGEVPDDYITCDCCTHGSERMGRVLCAYHSGDKLDCDGPSQCEVVCAPDAWCVFFELSESGRSLAMDAIQDEWEAAQEAASMDRMWARGRGVALGRPRGGGPGDLVHEVAR